MDDLFPGYRQTVIQQNYYSGDNILLFEGSTGLIENRRNVWLHPFRGKYFSVLEFSPFPYVKRPLTFNKSWTWKLDDISERWSDKRIIEYSGKQNATYEYKITGKVKVKTTLGTHECYEITATAKTSLGDSFLKTYYNETYGFMILDYTNIDGSKIRFELTRVYNYR